MGTHTLTAAKAAKKDEFYTQLSDIAEEVRHYREHFRGKTVLCNCDDPRVSNFFHYFAYQFEALGLKRLITTCYKNQDADLFSRHDSERAVYLVYDGDKNGNRIPDPEEIGIRELRGDGDFRSPECLELLKQADIVVTNPPFSRFREYLAQLMAYEKKFLIIANKNSLTNKDTFPLLMKDKLWIGVRSLNKDMWFEVLSGEEKIVDGRRLKHINACWITNMGIKKRHEELILYRQYSPISYPHYFNFDAIEVGRVEDIPCNYDGNMGVPLTFLDKYNPAQFEIVGQSLELANMAPVKARLGKAGGGPRFYLEQDNQLRRLFERIVIKRRKQA
jgi:hypothetical protein